MKNIVREDYIAHSKTKVYDLIGSSFERNISTCCHYTSTLVLDLLLMNATFRATHLFYLNDSSELVNGIEQLRKIFIKNKLSAPVKILDEIQYNENKRKIGLYSISFSSSSDLLHQWITYAKESGVCLVLDGDLFDTIHLRTITESQENKDKREKLIKGESIENVVSVLNNVNITHKASDLIYKMKYNGELNAYAIYNTYATLGRKGKAIPSKQEVDQKWEEAVAAGGGDAKLYLLLLAALLKNKDFESEEEIRAVFLPEKDGNREMAIKYFPLTNGILRPYCEITFCNEDECSLLPLKQLVVGPSGNQQGVFDSVVHRLKYGEKHIWDYWDSENKIMFEERFYSYIIGAMKRYIMDTNHTVDESTAKNVFEKLKNKWENETFRTIDFCTWEKMMDYNRLLNNNDIFLFAQKEDETDEIIQRIERDNYFTKEGVWIRKSNIPYIF